MVGRRGDYFILRIRGRALFGYVLGVCIPSSTYEAYRTNIGTLSIRQAERCVWLGDNPHDLRFVL